MRRTFPAGLDDAPSASAIALDVMRAIRFAPQDIEARRKQRLARLLSATARSSPFYRRRWRGIDIERAALEELPVVGKRELMADFADWVTDRDITLPALQQFMADPQRCGEAFLGRHIVWQSSGSSGVPAVFVQDAQAMAVYDALESCRRHSPSLWHRMLDPLMLSERFAFVGAIDGHFASHVSLQRQRRLRPWLAMGWRSFSILQPAGALVGQLNAFAPTMLATYPTAAALLADECERGVLRISPREVWTGGETLSTAVRQHVEAVFRCALRNSYGASEFLPMAWECDQGSLHLNSDWVILEPVDAHHRPVPPGTWSHTTLLTNLANTVQPLVRYELGDQVRVSAQSCGCGCTLPVIEVRGRCDDSLRLRGRDGRLVTLLPLALTTVLEDNAGVFDFELRQTGLSTLCLTLGPAVAPAARDKCRRALQEFARAQGLAPLKLTLRSVSALPHGRSGKVRRVCGLSTDEPTSETPADSPP
jgi:phenylacetate-CoA ligase